MSSWVDIGIRSSVTLTQIGRTVILHVEYRANTDALATTLHERLEQRLKDLDRVPGPQAILNELLNSD